MVLSFCFPHSNKERNQYSPRYLQIDDERRSAVEKTEKQRETGLGLHFCL